MSLLRDYGNNQIVCAIPADTYAQYQAVLATAVFLETTTAELNAIELSALLRQCLNRRILGQDKFNAEAQVWVKERNVRV